VALRYQHVMADRQAALVAALDALAQEAIQSGSRARGGHDQATMKQRADARGG
jgi:hypothetical protein